MHPARALCLTGLLGACASPTPASPTPATPPAHAPCPSSFTDGGRVVSGSATPVDPGEVPDGGTSLGLDDPFGATHIGRAPRRIDIDQFRASLEQLLGARWVGPQNVRTSEAPSGGRFEPEADLLEYFAQTLGRPDYITTTAEVLDPTITFAKLASDAVRSVCAAGLRADLGRPRAERRLLTEVDPTDFLPTAESRVRRNIAALALRLWGDPMSPDGETVTAVLGVFRVGSTRAGATPLDGWRAVCIDLATDPRFLTY